MPRLHLPRSSYDFSVYDFPCAFLDMVCDRGLRPTFFVCVYNSYRHRTMSYSGFRRHSESEPYRDRREIVWKYYDIRTL